MAALQRGIAGEDPAQARPAPVPRSAAALAGRRGPLSLRLLLRASSPRRPGSRSRPGGTQDRSPGTRPRTW